MKTTLAIFCAVLTALVTAPLPAAPPPGILNHQGRIVVSGENYTGTGHFKFALVDAAGTTTLWSNNGTGTGGAQPTAAVQAVVSQGHYALGLGDTALANMTVIPPSVFTANADVRLRVWFSTNGTAFEQLTPDRRITAAGYAITAGALADPSFIGTTGNTPLDFSVNNTHRALRLQPGSASGGSVPNLIGGSVTNTISADSGGSVIGGGGDGGANTITESASNATIAGGKNNTISMNDSVIGGGASNTASGIASTVAGGSTNTASSTRSTVGGGSNNIASNFDATVPGGIFNTASGDTSFAAGNRAKAVNAGAFVWADTSTNADFTSTASNQFLIRATGGVGINKNNPAVALDVNGTVAATGFSGSGSGLTGVAQLNGSNVFTGAVTAPALQSAGGPLNIATTDNQPLEFSVNGQRAFRLQPGLATGTAPPSLVGGFSGNSIDADAIGAVIAGGGSVGSANTISALGSFAFIGGGISNSASGAGAVVSGGGQNVANGSASTVPGGENNTAAGAYSFAAGRRANAIHQGAFVWADSQDTEFASIGANQFNVRAAGGARLITGGPGLKVDTDAMAFTGSAQTGRFGSAAGFDFNMGVSGAISGLLIEQGISESSGIFLDGDSITLWSPGDDPGNGNRLLRILDEDFMDEGAAAAEKFYVDGAGGFGSAGGATIAGGLNIDTAGANNGTLNGQLGLIFGGTGVSSGEGIASKRTAGGNQFGLDLFTGYTSRLSITRGGDVGIGTTSPGARLVVTSPTSGNPETSHFQVRGTFSSSAIPSGDRKLFEIFTTSDNILGYCRLGGPLAYKPGGGSWTAESDARLKKNVADLHGSLDRLLRLRSVSFEYLDPAKGVGPGPQIGFIAQEVREVLPQWVTEGPDGMLAVSVTGFESLTVDALRELRAEKDRQIAELKTENTALKERLDRLERAVETMQRPPAIAVAAQTGRRE